MKENNEELKQICRRIYEAIENSKLSYGEISKITGIPKSTLQKYAVGETKKVPIDRIKAIADATDVSAAWLMGWEKIKKEPLDSSSLSKIKQDAFKVLSEMNDEAVLAWLNVLNQMK